ncbi:MAG: prepilin peptidase [Myxococcota bacterium]|nr:prepilin peptidase [Myxococcota bacterium]
MSSALDLAPWRPGVIRGPRPERREETAPRLARGRHALVGWLRASRRATRSAVDDFARRVDAEAAGLDALSETSFDAAVAELRGALRRQGVRGRLLPRGFALVREAARRSLGTPHYDVQLFGGRVMAERGLAELETGEGKTLTATLPAALAALAGSPVHVITANDYLVERDAGAMRPLYERLGLEAGFVVERDPERRARRAAYACDVTYVTHKQVAFDYLRDRLALGDSQRLSRQLARRRHDPEPDTVLRGLCFAIVDEADSVLIDEARTPLILSRDGAPADEASVRTALWLARSLEADEHFRVDRPRANVQLTDAGRARLETLGPTQAGPLTGLRRREDWVRLALVAEHLYERDAHYLVQDGRLQIIDLPTGRRAPDRSFEGGVQALIEAKEGLALTPRRETIARISYQRFFRRYLQLAGMTGTAREVARELWRVYALPTVSVPTRLPSQRSDLGLRVLPTAEARWRCVVERVRELHAAQRPVLVGTSSVAASAELSARLVEAGLPHEVLSAQQDREEARLVAQAGEAGRITVATRMAGRGTDIRLGPGVAERGGLAVIATELGEARRIDRQLFGRSGRQGAAGSAEQWISLEDRVVEIRTPVSVLRAMATGALPAGLVSWLTRRAQRAEESRSALARRRLLESERLQEEMLAFSGSAD